MKKELYDAAVMLLSRREHSVKELRQKLLNKFSSQAGSESTLLDDVESVLEKLISQRYLDEGRFVESYVRYRSGSGFGPDRIYMELKERGIHAHLINSALDALSETIDWMRVLKKVWQKKFMYPPQDFTEKAKQMRFLSYRGFTDSQINHLLESLVVHG